MFLWLVKQSPAEWKDLEEYYKDKVLSWQNKIVTEHLVRKATKEACKEIKRLISIYPDFVGLKWLLQKTETETARKEWPKYTPKELFEIIGESQIDSTKKEAKNDIVLCLQKISSPDRKSKSYYAELLINHENRYRPLGPDKLRFLYLVLNAKLKGKDWVFRNDLEKEFYDNPHTKSGAFSDKIYKIKKWLGANEIIHHFEFSPYEGIKALKVRTTLLKEQISIKISDYNKAKRETK